MAFDLEWITFLNPLGVHGAELLLGLSREMGDNKDKENHEIRAKAVDSFGFASSRLLQKCEFFLHYVQGITMG